MKISRHEESTHVILVLEGRLDANTVAALDREFHAAHTDGARKFVWDCRGLTYLSSAGLRSFLQALKKLDASGGALIIAGAQPLILDVFDISGFKSLLTLTDDLHAAAATFR